MCRAQSQTSQNNNLSSSLLFFPHEQDLQLLQCQSYVLHFAIKTGSWKSRQTGWCLVLHLEHCRVIDGSRLGISIGASIS